MSREKIKQLFEECEIPLGNRTWFDKWKDNWENRPINYDDAWENPNGYRICTKGGSWLIDSQNDRLSCTCMCFLPIGMSGEKYKPKNIGLNKEDFLSFLEEVKGHRCIPWPG